MYGGMALLIHKQLKTQEKVQTQVTTKTLQEETLGWVIKTRVC